MHITKRLFLAAAMAASLVGFAHAADLDLNGVDRTVTDVADLAGYDGVTNSSETQATLTFNVAADMSYAGTISGNIKVVKEGTASLTFSADNSYSGGTQVNNGKLIGTSDNPFGNDHANNPIYVNTDLTDGRSTSTDTSTAIIFAKAGASASAPQTYGYPITCSQWLNHGARPGCASSKRGSGTLYNIALGESYIKLTGDITGGDISIRCGTIGSNWNSNPAGKNKPAISGNITALGGTLALSSRAEAFTLSGVVKVGTVYQPVAGDYPTPATLSNGGNEIGWYDCGRCNSGGNVTTSATGALSNAVFVSTTANFNKTGTANVSQNFNLGNYDQTINYPTIDYFTPRSPSDSVGMDAPHSIACGKTLTMAATATATNDWRFSSTAAAASLVWAPQGDFWLYNVSRAHLIGGSITVNRGGFAMNENCSFSNVTTIAVGAGAVFSNDCAFAGSLESVTAITLGAGAKAYLPADALTAGAVTLTLDPTAEVVFPDGTASITFGNIVVGGKHLAADTYVTTADGSWSRVLSQVKGAATVMNLNISGLADTDDATWDAGGADRKFSTPANWTGDTLPEFDGVAVSATFGASGTEAVVDGNTRLDAIVFDATGDFTLSALDGAAIRLASGIVGADDESASHTYTVSSPVIAAVDQNWFFGTNANAVLAGPVYGSGVAGVTNTITVSCYQPIWMVGQGQTDFVGKWNFPNRRIPERTRNYYSSCVFATGEEPFGGADATVSIAGGVQSGSILNGAAIQAAGASSSADQAYPTLNVSNAVISSKLEFPYTSSDDRYGTFIRSLGYTTNVFNGTVENVRQIHYGECGELIFNGPVNIHANNIGTDQSLCFKFVTIGSGNFENLKLSKVIFNGRITFPDGTEKIGDMSSMDYAEFQLNATSNVVAKVGNSINRYFTLRTGVDYAFAEGRTDVAFRWGGASGLHLDGHSQHIGSISAGHATTEISTTGPCELRISQTNDVTYLGRIDSRIVIAKDGAATLTWNQAIGNSVRLLDGMLALAGGVTSGAAEYAVVNFEGGMLGLPADVQVFKAYYKDAGGELKPVPIGTYRANDTSPIGQYLSGAGALVVRKSDVESATVLCFR